MDLSCQKWWNEALYGPHESISNPISPEMFAAGFLLGIQWLSLIFQKSICMQGENFIFSVYPKAQLYANNLLNMKILTVIKE